LIDPAEPAHHGRTRQLADVSACSASWRQKLFFINPDHADLRHECPLSAQGVAHTANLVHRETGGFQG